MIDTTITLNLKLGLHARPSAYIVKSLNPLKLDQATISFNKKTVDLRSILSLLTLFAQKGDELKVVLSGPDEDRALEILKEIFDEKDNNEIYEISL